MYTYIRTRDSNPGAFSQSRDFGIEILLYLCYTNTMIDGFFFVIVIVTSHMLAFVVR